MKHIQKSAQLLQKKRTQQYMKLSMACDTAEFREVFYCEILVGDLKMYEGEPEDIVYENLKCVFLFSSICFFRYLFLSFVGTSLLFTVFFA